MPIAHHDAPAPRLLDRDALFRQVGPLVGAVLAALLGLAISRAGGPSVSSLAQGVTITSLTIAGLIILPWDRLPDWTRLAPPLAYIVVAVLIRQATGGAASAYGQLALVPILWLAVYGLAWEVTVGVSMLAVALCAGLLLRAGDLGPELPAAGLLILEAVGIGMGVQRLFAFIRKHQDDLILLAGTDPLTGAVNRRGWDEELEHAVNAAAAVDGTVSLALMDVDHFKRFNDSRGHQAGDRLLKEFVARWRSQLREGDVLARIGGDEFALILPGCPLEPAHRIMNRLTEGLPSDQTCSTGVAAWNGTELPAELVARADSALYRSKEDGRNRVTVAA